MRRFFGGSEYWILLGTIIFGLLIVQGNTSEQGSHREGEERNPTHKVSKIINLNISKFVLLGD